MTIIIPIIILWALIIIVFAFLNINLSIYLYIAYLILVPYLQFKVLGLPLTYNVLNIILLLVLLYKLNKERKFCLDTTTIKPFLFLFFSLLMLSVFTDGLPWLQQFNSWYIAIMKTCIIPLLILNISKKNLNILKNIKYVLIISFSISCVYGLVLTQLHGMNPYTSLVANYCGFSDFADSYSASQARLSFSTASKIQSTTAHPMLYCLLLSFMVVIVCVFIFIEKQFLYLPILFLLLINIVISGVRTGIVALSVGFAYFILANKKIKLFLAGVLICCSLYFAISFNNDLSNIFGSVFDVTGDKHEVSGSSISMRMIQLDGTFAEIAQSGFWVGKGYDWHTFYIINNGEHPVIKAFESIIFSVLVDSGVLGTFFWLIFVYLLYKQNRRFTKSNVQVYLLDSLVIVYLTYILVTGDYGYISYFAIFYTYLMAYFANNNKRDLSYA